MEPDLSFAIQTRQSDRQRITKKNNPYGDDFIVDRIDLTKIAEELVDQEEKPASEEINRQVEFDDEQQQSYEQTLTNPRVLEWLNEMTSDPKETSVAIQDLDHESLK